MQVFQKMSHLHKKKDNKTKGEWKEEKESIGEKVKDSEVKYKRSESENNYETNKSPILNES